AGHRADLESRGRPGGREAAAQHRVARVLVQASVVEPGVAGSPGVDIGGGAAGTRTNGQEDEHGEQRPHVRTLSGSACHLLVTLLPASDTQTRIAHSQYLDTINAMYMARFAFAIALVACGSSGGTTAPQVDAAAGPPCTG